MFWNKIFMQYLEQAHRHVHTKMQQVSSENKLTLGEIKLLKTTSSGYFSVAA